MTISAPNRQGLKPFSFQTLYGTVETVPHKDFLVATQALQPVAFLIQAKIKPDRLKPALLGIPELDQFSDDRFLQHGALPRAAIFRHMIRVSGSRDDASHGLVGERES